MTTKKKEVEMEEALVWVLQRESDKAQMVLGSVDGAGVIWLAITAPMEPYRGSFYEKSVDRATNRLMNLTRVAEINGYTMLIPPTLLEVPSPGRALLPVWVDQKLIPAFEKSNGVMFA